MKNLKNLHEIIASIGVACVLGLLQACGGGGGGSATPAITVPAITVPIAVGSSSPLPSSVIESGGANIDHAGLINYYAGTYGASDDLNSNKDFIVFSAGDDGPGSSGGNEALYLIVRGSIGAQAGPAIAEYRLSNGVITVSYNAPTDKVAVGTTIALTAYNASGTYPANVLSARIGASVTFVVMTNGVSVVGAAAPFVVSSGYSYNMYEYDRNPSVISVNATTTVTSRASRFNHLISAQYVALLYQNAVDNVNRYSAFGNAAHSGALTPTGNLPTTGTVGYVIAHALGSYRDWQDGSNSRILTGSGALSADFGNSLISLNLDMNDHLGNDFVNITASALRLQDYASDNALNQFYDNDGSQPSVIDIDYATGTGLTDRLNADSQTGVNFSGSFYGPNAEEVGGGLCAPCGSTTNGGLGGPDNNTSTNDFLSIGFIGKRQ